MLTNYAMPWNRQVPAVAPQQGSAGAVFPAISPLFALIAPRACQQEASVQEGGPNEVRDSRAKGLRTPLTRATHRTMARHTWATRGEVGQVIDWLKLPACGPITHLTEVYPRFVIQDPPAATVMTSHYNLGVSAP